MTETPAEVVAAALAALSPEERAAAEAAAEQQAAAPESDPLYDARQDGRLQDPRDLGPVGG